MLFKLIYLVMSVLGILYGARAIYTRRIRVILWTNKEPGDLFYEKAADTVRGLPAVALGAFFIVMCLYMIKEHAL